MDGHKLFGNIYLFLVSKAQNVIPSLPPILFASKKTLVVLILKIKSKGLLYICSTTANMLCQMSTILPFPPKARNFSNE